MDRYLGKEKNIFVDDILKVLDWFGLCFKILSLIEDLGKLKF